MPPNAGGASLSHAVQRGAQVNKFGTTDYSYMERDQSVEFVKKFMPHAVPMTSDTHLLLYSSIIALANFPEGIAIDLGAGVFKSSNLIGAVFCHNIVFACDTFSGLPDVWVRRDKNFPIGTFAPIRHLQNEMQPPFPVLDNVVAVKGHFNDTIPQIIPIIEDYPIALVHIDSDTYSGAISGLKPLLPLLRVGTILVFDEFYNYPGYENGEYRAFMELIVGNGFQYTPLAFNAHHQQVAMQITAIPDASKWNAPKTARK
ncbi:MAG: TylF/MycF family methyltransferase [Puniceicoccales bacterium]|nr:TylF/MycF family methyltransferase [Puniceicoccales bacterium]